MRRSGRTEIFRPSIDRCLFVAAAALEHWCLSPLLRTPLSLSVALLGTCSRSPLAPATINIIVTCHNYSSIHCLVLARNESSTTRFCWHHHGIAPRSECAPAQRTHRMVRACLSICLGINTNHSSLDSRTHDHHARSLAPQDVPE